jgi:hypothetical protein
MNMNKSDKENLVFEIKNALVAEPENELHAIIQTALEASFPGFEALEFDDLEQLISTIFISITDGKGTLRNDWETTISDGSLAHCS